MSKGKEQSKPEGSDNLDRSAIVGHGEVDPATLEAHALNPRIHGEFQESAVLANLKDLGWLKPVIVNKRTGRILDGHLRVKIALKAGLKTVPVDYVDLDESRESQALLTLDPMAELADLEAQLVRDNLDAVVSCSADVEAFLARLAEDCGAVAPDFEPASEDEQGRLDEKSKVECPECGCKFAP